SRVVRSRRRLPAMPGPVGVEELSARLVDPLVRVSAEVVALGLQEVGRQATATVAVVERQRGRGRRRGDTGHGRLRHGRAPAPLGRRQLGGEEGSQQEALELGVLVVRGLDVAEEARADDAAAAPHLRYAAVVEVPAELL